MFHTHFGFTAPPFQLNPDPAFYFDSHGHARVLSYLKYGALQGEGFIVVTGEVGSGKTTLVHKLIDGLPPDTVMAAHVVSTQLDEFGLLHAICTAFGMPIRPTDGKPQLLAMLEHHAVSLSIIGRRALIVVDEAQNLGHAQIEELRMLSNFQRNHRTLIQSFLVGQPELRLALQASAMEPFRQRVIASCHLGPLDEVESRAYVEHRLSHVGWRERPKFCEDAFGAIHLHAAGLPRQINRLCTRLLIATWLADKEVIGKADVAASANELREEAFGVV